MHQAHRPSLRSFWRSKLGVGALLAVLMAGSAITVVALSDGVWDAICAAYPVGSPEWYLFECYLLQPGGNPNGS